MTIEEYCKREIEQGVKAELEEAMAKVTAEVTAKDDEAFIASIRSLMEAQGLDASSAMDILRISDDRRERYLSLLES